MKSKVFKNYIYNSLLKIFMGLGPFVTSPYLARVLHPDGIGIFSYTTAIAAAFALFAGLGVASYGQREIAYRQDDLQSRSKLFVELFVMRCMLTVLMLAVYLLFAVSYKQYSSYLLILSPTVFNVMLDISWFYLGMEDFGKLAVRDAFVKLAQIACIFLLVKTEADLGKYIIINVATAMLSNIFFFINLDKYLDFGAFRKVDIRTFRMHLLGSLSFFIPILSVELYSHFDKIMLGWLLEETAENGYYDQARKIVNMVLPLLVSLNAVLLSRVANHYAKGEKDEIMKWYRFSFNVILFLVFPVMVGLWIVSDNFVLWFFGSEYEKVSLLLKISCPMIFLMCVGNFVGVQYLSPTGKQKKMTQAYLTAAVVNVVLNLVFIPRLFSVGALLASVVAEGISCGMQVYFLKKSEFSFLMFRDAWKYILASGVMGTVLLVFHWIMPLHGAVSTMADIIIGIVVYFSILASIKEEIFSKIIAVIIRNKLKIY